MKPLPKWLAPISLYLTMLAVLTLSLLPIDQPSFSSNDKINHFIAFWVISILAYWAYRRYLVVILIAAPFGVAIEFLQDLTAYRYFSVADMFADFIGVVIGCATIFISTQLIMKFKQESNNAKS